MKLVPENINEVKNFERSTNLNKSLKIGKYNPDVWRKKHDGKIIMEVIATLNTPRGTKVTYYLPVKYGMDWDGYKDTIWFGREELKENNQRISFRDIDLQADFYWGDEDPNERTMWSNPEYFEREWIQNLVEDNAEKPFEDLMMEMTEGEKFIDTFGKWIENGGNELESMKYISL